MAGNNPHSESLRKGRQSQPGCYYFLTTSVAGRRELFIDRNHAKIVLNAVTWLHNTNRFTVDAAVVMPDHLHFVGQLGKSTLPGVMHTLKSYTARQLARTGIESPIWQDGYHDHGLRDDEDYRVRLRYVLDNPVRAGLVRRVEDYPFLILPDWWSSSDACL